MVWARPPQPFADVFIRDNAVPVDHEARHELELLQRHPDGMAVQTQRERWDIKFQWPDHDMVDGSLCVVFVTPSVNQTLSDCRTEISLAQDASGSRLKGHSSIVNSAVTQDQVDGHRERFANRLDPGSTRDAIEITSYNDRSGETLSDLEECREAAAHDLTPKAKGSQLPNKRLRQRFLGTNQEDQR
jgi:hypothetical protein